MTSKWALSRGRQIQKTITNWSWFDYVSMSAPASGNWIVQISSSLRLGKVAKIGLTGYHVTCWIRIYKTSTTAYTHLLRNPPAPFKSFYHNFYFNQGRLQHFINGLKSVINGDPAIKYAIVPISKGCKYSLEGSLLNSWWTHLSYRFYSAQITHLEELAITKGETHTSPMV